MLAQIKGFDHYCFLLLSIAAVRWPFPSYVFTNNQNEYNIKLQFGGEILWYYLVKAEKYSSHKIMGRGSFISQVFVCI